MAGFPRSLLSAGHCASTRSRVVPPGLALSMVGSLGVDDDVVIYGITCIAGCSSERLVSVSAACGMVSLSSFVSSQHARDHPWRGLSDQCCLPSV